MKRGLIQRLLVFMLSLGVIFSAAIPPSGIVWADDATDSVWTLLDDIDAAAAASTEGKAVAITMTTSEGITYVLPSATATGKQPAAKTASINGVGELIIDGVKNDYGWTVAKMDDGNGDATYTFMNSDGKYLYTTDSNTGIRVKEKPDIGGDWTVNPDPKYLNTTFSASTTRYLGVYNNTDWRTYTTISNNIKDQTLQFWAFESGGSGGGTNPDPDPELGDISTALAGAKGTKFAVKGVVTHVDGKNIFIQDATGGICLFFDEAPTTIALGDTVKGIGIRDTYYALPELKSATFTKIEDPNEIITLSAKETTIGALTNDDICTYISIPNLTVTGISGDNYTLKDESDAEITMYKPVTGGTAVTVGDKIDFTGAVGIRNNLQLRNTLASELTITEEPETVQYVPISTALAGSDGEEFTVKGVVTLVDGKNIFLQDATGGINLYLPAASNDINLGDTLYGGGARGEYKGLPQLKNATFTKVEKAKFKLKLEPAVKTADQITNDDICTYVTIKKLTVESISGKNYNLKDENDNAILLYNPVLEETLASGDVIDFTGAVGIYNNIQLRNTVGGEITKRSASSTAETYGLASTLRAGDQVVIYNASKKLALSSTTKNKGLSPVSTEPVDGVITTTDESLIWEVSKNRDGTYTFTQGEKTLGGAPSGNSNSLVATGTTAGNWTLVGPDEDDFNYYIYLGDLTSSHGNVYLQYDTRAAYEEFSLYGQNEPSREQYGITFYKRGADPETPSTDFGDLVTNLDQLTDGQTVAIYSQSHNTAISSKPNGDWYLKAKPATIENGKLVNFTVDYVWKVKLNQDGTYSFYANDDDKRSITAWKSGTYAELAVDVEKYPDNTWTITPAKTKRSFYISSPTVSNNSDPAYIEAYVRNNMEVFSGYFTKPTSNKFTESEFALQFYLVDPDEALPPAYDDGVWDGVMDPSKEYVIYNHNAKASIGLFKEANYAMDAIPTTLTDGNPVLAKAGNGAYSFKVESMGRYYAFSVDGKYLATNASEEALFVEKDAAGNIPESAKWFLTPYSGLDKTTGENVSGYIIYNKEETYGGTPVCLEYFSSVFSGWTFSSKTENLGIFLFKFYELTDDTTVYKNVVQAPSAIFDCKDTRYIEQDFPVTITLDDLCPEITNAVITYTAGSTTGTIDTTDENVCETSSDKKNYTFTIPASAIDGAGVLAEFSINIEVTNAYNITYSGEKIVNIVDEPFVENMTPAPGSQTGDEKKPVISAKIGNAGANPTFKMTLNENEVSGLVFNAGVLSYTPQDDMEDGRVAAVIEVTREDGVSTRKMWTFTVGSSDYQQYFGQLHSHTAEYSDGQGSLADAFAYIESLPESANVQFVAFTDHSNYFDSAAAANPADALNDKTQMVPASKAKWEEYTSRVAEFNAAHTDIIALAGFEMTWSGGPGHINTFASDGLVSRNNAQLNNKTGDSGMKLYYETLKKGSSISQFNHPGNTFGTFTDFSYWDAETDARIFLVEVGNGEGQIGAGGYYPSYEEYTKALDKGWHLAPTNNQDNHKGRWGNANDARDVILTNDFSEQGLYDAIRALRVYSTEDKNLKIGYTVNGEPMGTIFSETPDKLDLEVTLYDPDAGDKISKVEVIANGGRTVHTWNDAEELAKGYLTAELDPRYTYYYIRVTQEDRDLAVTAPVWTGKTAAMGINDVTASKDPAILNEEMTLTTALYNGTADDIKVKSLVYTIDGAVIGSDDEVKTIAKDGTLNAEFKYIPTSAKRTTVTVTAVFESGGTDYTFTKDVTFSVRENEGPLDVVPISTVQAQTESGYEYAIEGVVTSNASGYDRDTAFFDCIYVQDETAGICCFPVSGEYKIGDKVRIEGYTDFYQGEMELQVQSIEIIGTGTVEPTEVTAAQINDLSVLGSLVTIKGTIESFEIESGLVQTIMVKDAAGDVARVFIDGYITQAEDVADCEVGARITVTGLASYDNTFNAPEGPFPRIRIRNRKDIVVELISPVDEAKKEALDELAAVNIRDYSMGELNNVLDAIDEAKAAINAATTVDEVEAALAEAKRIIGAQETNAQKEEAAAEAAAQALDNAKAMANAQLDTIDTTPYSGEQLAAVENAIADARAKIEIATSLDDVSLAAAEANVAVAACSTDAEISATELDGARKLARSQLAVIDKSKYSGAERAAVEAALKQAIAEVDKAGDIDSINKAVVTANSKIAAQKTDAQKSAEAARMAEEKAMKVKTVTVNVRTVNAADIDAAVKKAGGSKKYVTKIIFGKKVKKIKKNALKDYKKVTTIELRTKSLTKKSVKSALMGSAVKTVKVNVGNKKTNKVYIKKYKAFFTRKNVGKRVAVK